MEQPLLDCDLPIDRPGAFAHNELILSGWAVSAARVTGVTVVIDARSLNASYGLDTPGVAARMPAIPGAGQAGYFLRIDTSAWDPGPRKVTIAAHDEAGNHSQISGEVTIRPFEPASSSPEENRKRIAAGKVAMWLDAPQILAVPSELEGPVEILGWAHAEGGIEAVIVTVDGCRQHEALRPIARPDLLGDYGAGVALDSGFASVLHETECEPGRHPLSVVALGRNGEATGIAGELLCLPQESAEAARVAPPEAQEKPRRRDPERHPERPECAWEDRALLAEADAAESRAEARLALDRQRSFAWVWRGLEAKARGFDDLQGELEKRTAALEEARAAAERLQAARDELEQRTAAELQRQAAELEGVTRSLSWRLTAPLRAARRLLTRGRS